MSIKTYVSAVAPRLYEDIPDLNKQAVLSAAFRGKDVGKEILTAQLTGPVAGLNSMLRTAKSPDYFYGLPQVYSSLQIGDIEETWLRVLAAKYTMAERDFFRITESVSTEPGVNGRQDYHGDWALQNTPIAAPDVFSRFDYLVDGSVDIYKLTGGAGGAEALHLSVTNPILTHKEHYVRWAWYEDIGGVSTLKEEGVEIYNESTNAIPELNDSAAAPPAFTAQAYPLVPIRLNGVDYDIDGNGLDSSDDIKRILSNIGVDAEELLTSVKDNPDATSVDDAFVGAGIGITETTDWAIAGLGETFRLFYESNPNTETEFAANSVRQNISISSAQQGGMDSILAYNWIRVTVLEGDPGYTSTFDEGSTTVACFPPENPADPPQCNMSASTNSYIFTVPVLRSPDDVGPYYYREIVVSGITLIHLIAIDENDFKEVQFEGGDDELVIPLFKEVIRAVPNRLRNDLAFGSLRLFIYAIEVVKLAWYETGIFKALLVIVAIVMAFYTFGASLKAAFAISALSGLIALGIIVIKILVYNYAVKWLVDNVGGDFVAILAVVYALYTGDFSTLATSLNTVAYPLITNVVKAYTTEQSLDLQKLNDANEAFSEEYEERLEELDAMTDILDLNNPVNLLAIVDYRTQPNTTVDEEPQSFYDRTTTVVDLPELTRNMVHSFHDVELRLPKSTLNETPTGA
jgi:hypothetical protein